MYTSLAESPECWKLEFQQAEIFADNFLIFADNFHIFASICVDKHIPNNCRDLKKYFCILQNEWPKLDKTSFLYHRFAVKRDPHNKWKEKIWKFADKSVQNILAFQRSLEFLQDWCLHRPCYCSSQKLWYKFFVHNSTTAPLFLYTPCNSTTLTCGCTI